MLSRVSNAPSQKIKKFINKIKETIQIEKIILFGSRARNDYLQDSDIDLIIISNDFEGTPFPERMDRLILLWESPHDLEALCYTPQEFKKKQQQINIIQQATEEGIEITV